MKQLMEVETGAIGPEAATLDLVVPFTTPELTRSAMAAAGRMGTGMNAAIRFIRVQAVPRPMEIDQSPISVEFLEEQMKQYRAAVPIVNQIILARDVNAALSSALTPESIVFLATKRRPWRTNTQRLAASLRLAGHKVVLVQIVNREEVENA